MAKTEAIDQLNKEICLFIKNKFFTPFKIEGQDTSLNKYAKACNLSSSTISKISDEKGYNIPVSTIHIIVEFEKTDLNEFFKEFSDILKSKKLS
ncbi:hypothetical protein [Sphingobacterium sp. BIGb0165]|uniref:hypothetical protein n=1 Tax=Sphingobacterium sp. BIGb0165 TaxID=2940615 RepID=UPI002166F12D|nr:hypothetical protein [Sphingobacterium sp. BIGb0165]MCS4225848.1 hypothetical protein [Sphingobacterium sp. BIGb0165]